MGAVNTVPDAPRARQQMGDNMFMGGLPNTAGVMGRVRPRGAPTNSMNTPPMPGLSDAVGGMLSPNAAQPSMIAALRGSNALPSVGYSGNVGMPRTTP